MATPRHTPDQRLLRAFHRRCEFAEGRPVSAAEMAYAAYRGEIGEAQIRAAQAAMDDLVGLGLAAESPELRFVPQWGLQIKFYWPVPGRKPSRGRRCASMRAIGNGGS